MGNIINFSLSAENVIAVLGIVVTIVIAVIGGVYAIITNTKKFELTENYKQELLSWYSRVVTLMIRIIHYCEYNVFADNEKYSSEKIELLLQLSSLTEEGRFYFPNVIKNDQFGDEKPSAYRGYRHITLEFLLYFYQIAKRNNCTDYISIMWKLEREFTSVIFDMIEPRKRNLRYSKYLEITIPEDQAIEDYISKNPKNINTFTM